MAVLFPMVRYLLPCLDVQHDDGEPPRVSIIGLVSIIKSPTGAFAFVLPRMSVYAQLVECRVPASGRIEIWHPDDNHDVFTGDDHPIPVAPGPLSTVELIFDIEQCRFRKPGLYYVQLWYNDHMISQQVLIVKE